MICRLMTMMMIKQFIICFTLCICCSALFAQHQDIVSWVSAGVSFDLTDDLSADVNEETRYNISTADLYQLNTNLELTYKFTKKIKVGIDYRYSVREGTDVNRVGISVGLREGIKDLDFSIRSKYQYAFVPDRREGTSWRNKGTVKYEGWKDLTPYFSAELFYSISNEIDQFDNYRLETGFSYELTKHQDLGLFYLYDKEFNVNNPTTLHIFGLGYVYKF